MFFDAFHDGLGQGECIPALLPSHQGWLPGTDRLNKSLKFRLERLSRLRVQLAEVNAGGGSVAVETQHQHVTPREINRQVFIGLEIPELSHLLGTDPAGREVGNRSILELHPGIGNIDLVGENRQSDAADLPDWRPDQPQDQVKVMDHQIKHHIHIHTARAEDAQTVNLKEHGAMGHTFCRQDSGIEPFEVPDLKDATTELRALDQFIRFVHRAGHRLLQQHIHIPVESLQGDCGMIRSRDDHADSASGRERFVQAPEGLYTEFRRDLPGAILAQVEDPDEFRARHLPEGTGMFPAMFSHANYSDGYLFVQDDLETQGCQEHRSFGRPVGLIPGVTSSSATPHHSGRNPPAPKGKKHSFPSPKFAQSSRPTMAIPDSSASRISRSRSKSKVLPASIARTVAFELRMASIVLGPTTGTSNLMSCRGLLTLTTTSLRPLLSVAARSMVASVPSMASTATQARSATTMVWPISRPAIVLAICRP